MNEGGRGSGASEREPPQFISVGLISVASRGLRLTFRWSFVRRSTEGEESRGKREGGTETRGLKGGEAERGDRLFYGNTLVGHAEEEDEVGAEGWRRKTDELQERVPDQ